MQQLIWQKRFSNYRMSVIQLTQSFLPTMQERNTGRIINLASEAALKPYVHLLPYSMSKAAIVNFTKGIAELVAGSKITANSLLPGPTLTEDTEKN